MTINVLTARAAEVKTPALVIGVFEDDDFASPPLAELNAATGGLIAELVQSGEFSARRGSTLTLHRPGKLKTERLVLFGVGKRADFCANALRSAVAAAARKVRTWRRTEFAVVTRGLLDARIGGQVLTEGILLGLYEFNQHKSPDPKAAEVKRATLIALDHEQAKGLRAGVALGAAIAQATNNCRDLVNEPSNLLTPTKLASRAMELCKGTGVKVEVWDKRCIVRERLGALLSVAQGSAEEPRFIIMEHKPAKAKGKPIVLVGKAVTFDTGGVSLKSATNMEDMKCDMAGGATVIATLAACGRLKLPRHVIGMVPATENMPSGTSIKPGDVVRARNGKSIEILNTDAEGRLILADALCVASERKPAAIVDLATLTGACVVALGDIATGMIGTDQPLMDALRIAGETTGDRVWQLPLWDEYREHVKSHVAEVKNVGKARQAGATAGAAFLEQFVVAGIPWAHLDIAGPAYIEEVKPLHPRGGTGWGVRLLLEWLRNG